MIARKYRFHGHNSLRFVYTNGTTVRNRWLSLKFCQNSKRVESRLAVVVTKKVAKKAPTRNHIRRRIYEAIRQHWAMLRPGYDLVVTVFDEKILDLTPTELNQAVAEVLTHAKLYK